MIPASRKRLVVLYLVLGGLLGGLGYRAWSLQVGSHSSYVALSNADRIRDIVQPPVRGEIVDDNGVPLVSNASALVVSVNMSVLSQQSDGGLGRAAHAGPAARHHRRGPAEQDPALHRRGAAAVLAGLALPADPGGAERAAADRRPGAGGQAQPARHHRAGPAGHQLRPADQHGRVPDPARLPAAHHRGHEVSRSSASR